MSENGRILAISVSKKKGTQKSNIDNALLIENYGIEGDAHAGNWHRQVSLLAEESIEKIRQLGLDTVMPGNFAENITTKNFDLLDLKIEDRIQLGETILEITQIGKECHSRCAIYNAVGDCVMPREGIFAKVLRGGKIKINDSIIKLDIKND